MRRIMNNLKIYGIYPMNADVIIVIAENKEEALEIARRTCYQSDVPISYLNPQSVRERDVKTGLVSHYQDPEQVKRPMFRQRDKELRELLKAKDSHLLKEEHGK